MKVALIWGAAPSFSSVHGLSETYFQRVNLISNIASLTNLRP